MPVGIRLCGKDLKRKMMNRYDMQDGSECATVFFLYMVH